MVDFFSDPANIWVWSFLQTLLVVTGFAFVTRQLKLARDQNSISHLNFFRDLWYSPGLLRARLATVEDDDLSSRDFEGYEAVLAAFLEDLAAANRIGQINRIHLWSYYSFYIEGYWNILKPKLSFYRKKISDPSYFSGFERLYADMQKISRKKGAPPMSVDYLEFFREEEAREVRFLLAK